MNNLVILANILLFFLSLLPIGIIWVWILCKKQAKFRQDNYIVKYKNIEIEFCPKVGEYRIEFWPDFFWGNTINDCQQEIDRRISIWNQREEESQRRLKAALEDIKEFKTKN